MSPVNCGVFQLLKEVTFVCYITCPQSLFSAVLLATRRATCDIKGPDGSTPLCWTALQGHVGIAELLLQVGTDPVQPIIGIRPQISQMLTQRMVITGYCYRNF
ncbi:MAG: hypothetical protein GY845_36030 [Planctomycetes bacterium]|nr:hypothetical protein [Planctomycetota bacterium]